MSENGNGLIKSVQKSLVILKYILNSPGDVSLIDLENNLGYNGSTMHHLLKTLIHEGFISQNVANKKYGLGPELFRFLLNNQQSQKFFDKAYPFLEDCAKITGETTNMFIRVENEAVCVIGSESQQTLKAFLMIGRRIPLTCTAVGKVFLAFMPEHEVRDLIKKAGLEQYLPNTITDIELLLDDLRKTRERGYSIEREEYEEMITAVAAPVFDDHGEVIAAIANIAPSIRTDEDKIKENAAVLINIAEQISKALM